VSGVKLLIIMGYILSMNQNIYLFMLSLKMQKKSSIFKGNLRYSAKLTPYDPSLYFYKNSKNKGKTIWLSLMTPSFNYKNKGGGHMGKGEARRA